MSKNRKSMLFYMTKPPWRTIVPACSLLFLLLAWYPLWSPGEKITDGRHDLGQNGIWIQHGWLGDDSWFEQNQRDKQLFRSKDRIRELSKLLKGNHIQYVYPHLCPCCSDGTLSPIDPEQTRLFLQQMSDFSVLPWIGGVLDEHAVISSSEWRETFVQSVTALLESYPQLAGVHLNIEPLPSGTEDFITLLKYLKERMPNDKILSIAAYPPPTKLHPFPDVHWDELYYRQVETYADQLVVMMYDTAIQREKVYQYIMARWTKNVTNWVPTIKILLGVSAYDDNVDYHNPNIENIENGLLGIHAGLADFDKLPSNYVGVALYCEWEMTQKKWDIYEELFLADAPVSSE